jgi:CRP/FNR family transcriptional regulator
MEFFESTLKVNTNFTYNLMKFFAVELQESEKRMSNLAHMPVKSRIAQALLALQNQFGLNERGFIDIELTRQDLASFVGASYETVFKVLNEFTQNKSITVLGKSILIDNENSLLQLVKEHKLDLS